MTRISLVLALSLGLSACTGDSLPTAPTATEFDTESVSSVLSKSPRIDGPPIPPVFFNALNPEPFVDFREWPEWVPIIFYREMSCTPHDINFLSTAFDFRSLGCPSLIGGHLIWTDKDPNLPQVVHERALDLVPIWFVTVEEWESMATDDFIGWDELRAAPSFREGLADFYHGRQNLVASTVSKDIRGYLTSLPDTRFRMHFVGRLEFLDDGTFIEHVPQLTVEFYGAG